MENRLLFGAAYYPEYMPYDRIHEDFSLMKEAGMNVVRVAESTWSTLEPKEGMFDFSYIDSVLSEAQKQNLMVIIGTPTYAVPPWLVKKDPDVLVTGKDGRASYGPRQIVNLLNPTFRDMAEKMIRELASYTAGQPQVIGFQIDNETKHYNNFGSQAQQQFRVYLQEKFQTPEAFNDAFHMAYWSNAIFSWEDLPDIRGCINGGLEAEYQKFLRKMAAEYLAWQADLVKEYKREDQFITQNFDFEWKPLTTDVTGEGYSYGVQPFIDHYEASRCLTLIGTDIYHPTQDELTGAEIASGGDAMRCLRKKSYLNMEVQAQGFKDWTPYPGQLTLQAYSHLASGSLGLLYWNWNSIHNGYETCWHGILSHDLKKNPVYEEIAELGAQWEKMGFEMLNIQKQNKIAILTDNHSLTALQYFPVDEHLSYNDIFRWMYDSLYELNLECDVLDVRAFEDGAANLADYRILITPALYSVSEAFVKKLETYVEQGGILISSFRSFVADEQLSIYPDTLPYKLHRIFGMHYQQITDPGTTKIDGAKVQYFMELLESDGAEILAEYDHPYWGRFAGITCHEQGAGAAYYIGCYTDKAVLQKMYTLAAERADLQVPGMGLCWPVVIRSGVNQRGETIHYVLHYSQKEQTILCPYAHVQELQSGQYYQQGDKIRLKDWDVAILREVS